MRGLKFKKDYKIKLLLWVFCIVFVSFSPLLQAQLSNRRIGLDPGHGDGVNMGVYISEGTWVRLNANRTKELMEAAGAWAPRTRTDATDYSISYRRNLLNSWNLNLAISIHSNAASAAANGFEVFYCSRNPYPTTSRNWGIAIMNRALNDVHNNRRGTGIKECLDAGRGFHFGIIREWTHMPIALPEWYFHTNSWENYNFHYLSSGREKIAQAHYHAACDWFGTTPDPPKSTEFSAGDVLRTTADPSLNLRSGPGTTYSIIKGLPYHTLVTVQSHSNNGIYANNNHWWRVQVNSCGTYGWLAEYYLEVAPICVISTPGFGGAEHTTVGVSTGYWMGERTCSLHGNTVDYAFYWGDGTNSGWGSRVSSKTWWTAGTYNIRGRARCTTSGTTSSYTSYHSVTVHPRSTEFSAGDVIKNTDSGNTNLRDDRGLSSNVIKSVSPGEIGTVVSHSMNGTNVDNIYWWRIQLQNCGTQGWISQNRIELVPVCSVGQPTLSGPTSVHAGESATYTLSAVSCALGCSVEYIYNWGDGSWSGFGSRTRSKTWSEPGTYEIIGQAKCVESGKHGPATPPFTVTVTEPPCNVGTPTLSGPTSGYAGVSNSYSLSAQTCQNDHDVEYYFQWGDGTNSGWGSRNRSKTWSQPGTYEIRGRARCAMTQQTSSYTPYTTVTIEPSFGLLEIEGPADLHYNVTQQYISRAHYHDGTNEEVTSSTDWSLETIPHFSDDFEYSNQGAMESVWTPGTGSGLNLSTAQSQSGSKSASQDGTAQSNIYNLGNNVHGSDELPLVLEFWLYDSDPSLQNARHFISFAAWSGEEWGAGSLENLIAMGIYNLPQVSTNYYVRTLTGGGNWQEGSVARSQGWRKMQMKVYSSEVEYYIDGQLALTDTYTAPATGWNSIRLGSGLTSVDSGLTVYYDDISLYNELTPSVASVSSSGVVTTGDIEAELLLKAEYTDLGSTKTAELTLAIGGCNVSIPEISGPSSGYVGTSYNYTLAPSTCSEGHDVEYSFNWGDDTYTNWSTETSASKTWSSHGEYQIRARARCAETHATSEATPWYTVSIASLCSVGTPGLTGPSEAVTGSSQTFEASEVGCSNDHNVEYYFDWGDGSSSGWVNNRIQANEWQQTGSYDVRVRARCADTEANSGWSAYRTIIITPPREYRAIWVDTWSPGMLSHAQIDELVALARENNLNTIVAEVRKAGDAYYESDIVPRAENILEEDLDPLGYLLEQAHDTSDGKQRIEVHAWLVMNRAWRGAGDPQDPGHIHYRTEWLSRNADGDITDDMGNSYVDLGNPDAMEHMFDVVAEIVANYPVDGINLDYIRYPESSGPWGYNDVAIDRFESLYPESGPPSESNTDWLQFKRDNVTQLVKQIYVEINRVDPNVLLSADTITWGGVPLNFENSSAYASVFQDWVSWMEKGYLDLNMPMIYKREHETDQAQDYRDWVDFAVDNAYGRHVLSGIGSYLNTTAGTIAQIDYARNNDADGIVIYSYHASNTDGLSTADFLDELKDTHFQEWTQTPSVPWKEEPQTGILAGRVRCPDGNPLEQIQVAIDDPETTIQTEMTGFFGFFDLNEGSYSVTISSEKYGSATEDIQVDKGGVAWLDYQFPPVPQQLVIDGPSDLQQNTTQQYSAKTVFSEEVSTDVSADWSLSLLDVVAYSFNDDFDGYSDQAAFEQVWEPAGGSGLELTTEENKTGVKSVYQDGEARANILNLDMNLEPTDDFPVVLEFWLYDSDPTAINARHFVSFAAWSGGEWGAGSLENLLAMGIYNQPGGENYHIRTFAGGSGWASSSVERTEGWHKMQMKLYSDQVQYYIDDTLAFTDSYAPSATGWNAVRLGSGLSSTHDELKVYYDGFSVYIEGATTDTDLASVDNEGLVTVGDFSGTIRLEASHTTDTGLEYEAMKYIVVGGCQVSTPVLAGPETGYAGISNEYEVTPAECTNEHDVEYLFDWGDGTNSGWSVLTAQSQAWDEAGTYAVKVHARCVESQVTAEPTPAMSVVISPACTVSIPGISGPVAGYVESVYTYTLTSSQCSNEHSIEYEIEWGDGSSSGWIEETSADNIWTAPGNYEIRARARCVINEVVSEWSDAYIVDIIPLCDIATPTLLGPDSGYVGAGNTYSLTDTGCSNGHEVEYFFSWGDGSDTGWIEQNSALKTWATVGSYDVRGRARCAQTQRTSEYTSITTVTIHPALEGLEIEGPADIDSSVTQQFTAWASYYDGTVETVDADWSVEVSSVRPSFEDSFDYASQGDFESVWQPLTGTGLILSSDQQQTGDTSVRQDSTGLANLYDLGKNLHGTDNDPLVLEFWLYDSDPELLNARQFISFAAWSGGEWGAGSLENLLAMGIYNQPEVSENYYVRTLTGGSNWVEGNVARTQGWRKMQIKLYSSQVEYYVDGQLALTDTYNAPATGWNSIRLGSGLSSTDDLTVYYDNISIYVEPGENSELALVDASGLLTTGDFSGEILLQASYTELETTVTDELTIQVGICDVAAPADVSGPEAGYAGTAYTFNFSESSCSLDHDVEYRLDWGDGTTSAWSLQTSAEKIFDEAGTYDIRAQARCLESQEVSPMSSAHTVVIQPACDVETPSLSGPQSGLTNEELSYTLTSTTCINDHTIEYFFSWGDGTDSGWGTRNQDKTWTSPGTYVVEGQARCAENHVTSGYASLTVTIMDPCEVSPPSLTGPTSGFVGSSYNFTVSGAECSNQHDLDYLFDWDDGSTWGWSSQASASKTWTSSGNYGIRAWARCTESQEVSAASGIHTVNIAPGLSSLSIEGPQLVSADSEQQYNARAFFNDGTDGTVAAQWSLQVNSIEPYFTESFQYNTQADFETRWPVLGSAGLQVSTQQSQSLGTSVYQDGSGRANLKNLGRNLQGTDNDPLVLEFWLYDSDPGLINARHFISLAAFSGGSWGSGNLENLIAMGIYNQPGGSYYHIRTLNGGSGWAATSVERSQGWRKMQIKIYSSEIRYYVDNQLAYTDSYSVPATGWNSIRLGSGLSSTHSGLNVYYDDMSLYTELTPNSELASINSSGLLTTGDFSGDLQLDASYTEMGETATDSVELFVDYSGDVEDFQSYADTADLRSHWASGGNEYGWSVIELGSSGGAEDDGKYLQLSTGGWFCATEAEYVVDVPEDGDYRLSFYYMNGHINDPIGSNGGYLNVWVIRNGSVIAEADLSTSEVTSWTKAQTSQMTLSDGDTITIRARGNTLATLSVTAAFDQFRLEAQ